jgi:hypothetical protein
VRRFPPLVTIPFLSGIMAPFAAQAWRRAVERRSADRFRAV